MSRPAVRTTSTDEDELRKRGYTVGAVLGEGSYAKVKWALSEKLNKKVALKIISKKRAPTDFQQKFLPRELETMKMLDHPNIVKLYDILHFKDKIVMVMEMAGHGDLLEYVKLRGALTEDKARQMFAQLVSAVDYMHGFHIVHRDLKCENILLDVENNVKLSDFGFARTQYPDQLSKTYCGSAAYASPEVLQGIPYRGSAYDVWSLGVILYIMVCGSMPYDDTDVKKMIKYQTERKVGFSKHRKISSEVKDLIHGILEANVDRRMSVTAIRDSPWMASVRSIAGPPPVKDQQQPHQLQQHRAGLAALLVVGPATTEAVGGAVATAAAPLLEAESAGHSSSSRRGGLHQPDADASPAVEIAVDGVGLDARLLSRNNNNDSGLGRNSRWRLPHYQHLQQQQHQQPVAVPGQQIIIGSYAVSSSPLPPVTSPVPQLAVVDVSLAVEAAPLPVRRRKDDPICVVPRTPGMGPRERVRSQGR